jgi:hypothetical protein
MDRKFKQNASKTFSKYVCHALGTSKKLVQVAAKNGKHLEVTSKPKLNLTIDKICGALGNLRNCDSHEYEDQRYLVENLITLIAEDRLDFDSIHFKKICTQVRLLLDEDKVKYISSQDQKVIFSFPEKDVCISSKEYELYSQLKDNEEVMRVILGVPEDLSKKMMRPEKIKFKNSKNSKLINDSHKSTNCDKNTEFFEKSNRNILDNVISNKCNKESFNFNNTTLGSNMQNNINPSNNAAYFNCFNGSYNNSSSPQESPNFNLNQFLSLNNSLNMNNPYSFNFYSSMNNNMMHMINPSLIPLLQNMLNNGNVNSNKP